MSGPFKLKSGNKSPLEFKQMGSSPAKQKVHPPNPAGPKGHGWNPEAQPEYISEKLTAGKYGMPKPWGAMGPSIHIGDDKPEPKIEPSHSTYVDSPEVIAARTGKSKG